jgi:surface polysaccharide O-acyltransferase-like enzyme
MENFKNKIKNSLNAIKIFATSLFFLVVGYFFFKGVSKNNKENSTNIKTDERIVSVNNDMYNSESYELFRLEFNKNITSLYFFSIRFLPVRPSTH